MSQALTYLYQIYSAFLDLVFNQFELFPNVTIGWVGVAILVMTMIITSILNIPRSAPSPSSSSFGKKGKKGKKNG